MDGSISRSLTVVAGTIPPSMDLLDRLLSDRRRGLKMAALAAIIAGLACWFVSWSHEDKASFAKIVRDPSSWPGAEVGPETHRVRGLEGDDLIVIAYGASLPSSFPAGPGGEALRAEARELASGGYASVTAVHLDGLRFELVDLVADPYRRWKLALSGTAVLAVAGLLPVFFRWSRGAFRPRVPAATAGGGS